MKPEEDATSNKSCEQNREDQTNVAKKPSETTTGQGDDFEIRIIETRQFRRLKETKYQTALTGNDTEAGNLRKQRDQNKRIVNPHLSQEQRAFSDSPAVCKA